MAWSSMLGNGLPLKVFADVAKPRPMDFGLFLLRRLLPKDVGSAVGPLVRYRLSCEWFGVGHSEAEHITLPYPVTKNPECLGDRANRYGHVQLAYRYFIRRMGSGEQSDVGSG